jgi:hypothetical protein
MKRSSRDSGYQDLDELRVRLAEFRSGNRLRTRLPEELWRAAAEIAAQRGIKITSRVLHLDTNGSFVNLNEPAHRGGGRHCSQAR